MNNLRGLGAIALLFVSSLSGFAKHPLTFEDMMKVRRISDPQISPDSRWVAYVQTSVDLNANKKTSHIWLVSMDGGGARQLTTGEGSDSRPRWSPDGGRLALISTRGGKSQVWILPVSGGE
ncbi:MAG: S9 family peptidase, partial [Acidobacteria bacterium]